jgi:hypothetical protein
VPRAPARRHAPQIIAVELDQIEGIEEDIRVMVPVPDAIEGCHPVFAIGPPSIMQDRDRRLASASPMRVKSLPGRL